MIPARVRVASALSLLLLALVATYACGGEEEPGSSAPRTVEVAAEDAGSKVELAPGDSLVITLDSNVTTGFAWTLAAEPDPAVLEPIGSTYVSPDSDLLGAGGQEVWTFRAVTEGSTDLELRYERSSGEVAEEPFTLSVVVVA